MREVKGTHWTIQILGGTGGGVLFERNTEVVSISSRHRITQNTKEKVRVFIMQICSLW